MYIEEITIDGFKSYAKRVTVSGFDQHFNAITGLNGSGKSNILDAICFVLGIKNLSAVRATNLQELVYKQGQAGVTKATVSITFDNSDPSSSPTGYEDKQKITVTRQIVVGGRDKYLINGVNAQQSRVADMFHSVQLNVNNPHFLIMQGRITKVLNMKPAEILGLLEEAAGTKMYDKKRDVALKTLEKKEKRLTDIDQLLEEEMLPALEKLRKERAAYMEWQQACADAEALGHVVHAHRYWAALQAAEGSEANIARVQAQIRELERSSAELKSEIAAKAEELRALKADLEVQSSGEVSEVSKRVDEMALRLAKGTSALEAKQDDLKALEAECARLEASLEEVSEARMSAVMSEAAAARDGAHAQLQEAERLVEAAVRQLAGAESGDGRDGSNRSLAERVLAAESDMKRAEADAKEAGLKAKHLEAELRRAEKQLAAARKEDAQLERERAQQSAAVAASREALDGLGIDDAQVKAAEDAVEAHSQGVAQWQRHCNDISTALGYMINFSYSDPKPGFDRRRVRGVLARLVRIQRPDEATALEVAAGGKLTHIVVDTEDVGRDLLKGGRLKKRYTIVPLNKTKANPVSRDRRAAAAAMTHGRATLALELIGYDEDVARAMEYAFGNAFVCQDAAAAKKVAYSREVGVRGISLDGDDFSPAGTLTGGSRNRNTPVLARLHELADAERKLAEHQGALREAQARLASMAGALQRRQQLREQLELAQHALALVEARVQASASHQAEMHAQSLTEQLAAATAAAADAAAAQPRLVALAAELQRQIKNFDKEQGSLIKAAKAAREKAARDLEGVSRAAQAAEQALQMAIAQQDTAAEERAALTQQLAAARAGAEAKQAEAAKAEEGVRGADEQLARLRAQLAAHKERLARCSEDLGAVAREKSALEGALSDAGVAAKKLEHGLARAKKEALEWGHRLDALVKDNKWLLGEKARLNQAGGPYDFGAMDMARKEREFAAAAATKADKGKNINRAVLTMFEQCEKDYTGLMDRRRTVLNDRDKIKTVIEELDTKKETALELSWRKVNKDFGEIFTTLLPGTEATLQPPEGATFLEGLEVRVAFGGVWKESLSELSGGQRSLLALSLILALLCFRPAPLYILDEVDAALDLSHTQNIGRMIKKYFPFAQFIIVSLKEGMFNNANVLFRTRFVDGTSTVSRTANAPAAKKGAPHQPPAAKKGRAAGRFDDQENE